MNSGDDMAIGGNGTRGTKRRRIAVAASGLIAAVAVVAPPASPDQAVGKVPAPGPDEAVVTVKMGGVRDPKTKLVQPPPAGAQLQLYEGDSAAGSGAALNEPWATCTADADGDCSFTIPDTGVGGANRDRRFWIGQVKAPDGYYADSEIVTSADGATFQDTPYEFQTGVGLRGGQAYSSAADFMVNAPGVRVSSGLWLDSLENPPFPDRCGLNVALVLDLSGSVADSNAEGTLKGAATALVDALTETPSQVALFTFGSRAPARGENNINRPLTPVSTVEGAGKVKNWIDGISVPVPHEATNWDRGLMQVAETSDQFDVVVVVTDGNPTRYGTGGLGTGILTRFIEMENAVFSANAVKSVKSARIVAIGVGDGATGIPGDNFAAISGSITGDQDPLRNDYFQTGWDQAAQVIASVAQAGCAGSLSVVKQIVPQLNSDGDVTGSQPAAGWEFSVTGAGLTPAKTGLTTALGTGADSTEFTLDQLDGPGRLIVAENVGDDYDFYPVKGADGIDHNAECVKLGGGTPEPLAVRDEGEASFSVAADAEDVISCTVYNQHQATPPASIRVSKKWVLRQVDADRQPLAGVPDQVFDEGSQPGQFQAGLNATLAADPGVANYTGLTWGAEYAGMTKGARLSLTEDPAARAPSGCNVVASMVTGQPDGSGGIDTGITPVALADYEYDLEAGLNEFQVTNTVACLTRLSLYKTVDSRAPAPPPSAEWTLRAIPLADPAETGGPPLAGPRGNYDETDTTTAPTGPVTPGWTYALAESGGDPRYVQWSVQDPAEPFPDQATGSWICNLEIDGEIFEDPSGWLSEGLRGAVAVPWGGHVHCIAVNYTGNLTIEKRVRGGSAQPGDWTFTVTPVGEVPAGLTALAAQPAGGTVHLRPAQTYKLSEDSGGPANYVLDSVDCVWDELDGTERTQHFTAPPELAVGMGGSATCTFNNRAVAQVGIAKSDSLTPKSVPGAGSRFDYHLDVTSDGAAAAQSVVVSDAVPPGLRIVSVSAEGSGWTDLTSGNDLRLTNPSLPAGRYRVTVTVEVTAALDVTKDLVNEACVGAANDAATADVCASDTVPGGPPPATQPPTTQPPTTQPPTTQPPTTGPPTTQPPTTGPPTTQPPTTQPPTSAPASPPPTGPAPSSSSGPPTGSASTPPTDSGSPPGQGANPSGNQPGTGDGQPPKQGGGLPRTGASELGWMTGLAAIALLAGASLLAARRRARQSGR
ncbi:MAG: DUF11 domain-containing protein [Bifidobacteriaceae bacterium]|jgi:uncharacterized repeat protein (TIGR01451 family)/LPXTG-motif cell wall-anchored protein|nr:DUF11 domain-containing protein [Bifidobacteriaceae bacterium]